MLNESIKELFTLKNLHLKAGNNQLDTNISVL